MKKFGRAGSTFGTVVAAAVVIAVASTGGAVAGGLITSKQIKNNTIKSIDVRNGSLKSVDITDGTIAKADLAAATQGFTSIVTKRETVAIGANSRSTRNVLCPAGSVAVSGGAYVVPTGIVLIGTTDGVLERSHPSQPDGAFNFAAADNISPQSWRTVVFNDNVDPSTAVHYAMCASK